MLYNKVFEWWLRIKSIINWGDKIFYKNRWFWKIGSKWGQSNFYILFCEFSWKIQSFYKIFRLHGMLCAPIHLGRLVKRLPPTANFHRFKFKLARFQFAFRLKNPEYELVKSALTDFDLSASGVHEPIDTSWCANEKNLAPTYTERLVDPWSASDWNTGAEQDWVYGDYGDYGNYDDLVKYVWINRF